MDSGAIIQTPSPVDGSAVVAGFAADLRPRDVSYPAIRQAERTLRDTIGTMLGGLSTAAVRTGSDAAGVDLLSSIGRPQGGVDETAPIAFAAALAASALDFDDGHYLGGAIHPGSVVIPALLVASRGREVSLQALLTAQVAGYEVGLRIAHLLWPRRAGDRYHCTGTAACVAAATAVAKLRGGDRDVIARAIEIAWCHAPMAAFQLPMIKEAIGWSAATAIFAVRLAESGFKSYLEEGARPAMPDVFPPTPFDSEAALADPFVASLGERFEAADTYLKPFSCCRFTHAAAAELLALLDGGLDPEEVVAIRVGTHRQAVFLGERRPPSLEHAQYSFPFVLGAIAADRDAGPAQISERRLSDPAILDFAARVTVEFDAEMAGRYPEHYASRLCVDLAGGGQVVRSRAIAPGDTEEPLSDDVLVAKFDTLAAPVVGSSTSDRLLALLAAPDRATTGDLLETLTPRARHGGGAPRERRADDAH